MSKYEHESGSDRIAEAANEMEVDIIVNVQGDEPFVKKEPLEKLLQQFNDASVQVASLMQELKSQKEIEDSNYVKVAVDKNMNSLFFSRSVIPYHRDATISPVYYEHIGVYAPPEAPFRKLELALEASGLSYNIIRPNWFMQNFQTYWISGILKDKKIYFPGGDAKVSFISVKDIAATAVSLLLTDEFKNQAFTLTGREAITHSEVAAKLSNATGLVISYIDITSEDFKKSLLGAGLPEDYADFMVYIAGSLKEGNSSPILDSVKKITGNDPISFDEYALENKKAWLG